MVQLCKYWGFILASYAAFIIYGFKACRYSREILGMPVFTRGRGIMVPAAALAVLWMAVFSGIPMIVVYIFLYSLLLLYFLLAFQNSLSVALFASSIYLFHTADLYMLLFGVFSMICRIRSMESFRGSYLYPALILLVALASTISLEVFRRTISQDAIQKLISNRNQLYFTTTSQLLIDAYLFILSIAFDGNPYTGLMLLFFVVTSVLLFGAFYTSFIHAVKMSILEVYETKSRELEQLLEQTNRDIGELKSEAYTDVLTNTSSRRYGLLALQRALKEKKKLCVCMIDLDGLKYVNDTLGHQEGDRYLTAVARVLLELFERKNVSRLGGDEFLVLLPDRNEEEAELLMQEVNKRLAQFFLWPDKKICPIVSYGIADAQKLPFCSVSDLLHAADEKMYEMKKHRKKAD